MSFKVEEWNRWRIIKKVPTSYLIQLMDPGEDKLVSVSSVNKPIPELPVEPQISNTGQT